MSKITLREKISDTLKSYMKSQLIVIIVISSISWIFLSLIHIKYALFLAAFTGALSVIPIFGMTASAIVAFFVAVFDGVWFLPSFHPIVEGIVIIIFYALLNFLSDLFLSPYLIGKSSKIHPALLFVSMIVATSLFGIIGTLLAAPVVMMLKTVWEYNNKSSV